MSKKLSSALVLIMFSIWLATTPGMLAVKFTVTVTTTNTNALARFNKYVGARFAQKIMADSTKLIWNAFSNVYNKSIQQVTLYIADTRVDAITTGDKINVSASYIERYQGNLTREFQGIVYHQMTGVWQQTGKNKAPAVLLSGIADFMRLEACLVTSQWARPGGGARWDENSTVTARFLDYWNYVQKRYVSTLNKKMMNVYQDSFMTDGTGLDMTSMWSDYKANASSVSLNYNCGHK